MIMQPAGLDRNAAAGRAGRAESAGLRHLLAPGSVVVIGASRSKGRAGRAILDNIRAGGYAGRLWAVNPRARQIGGERCLASVLDLPEPADLAVIAVPAASVLAVAEQCGQRGVRSLVVITSGLDAGACADLLAVCRRHGMRLAGPDGFGVAVPGIGLNATFAVRPPLAGVAGLVMQSGGLGFALVAHLSRLGVGISSFASVGEKLDVSSNDMLQWWEHDGVTKVAVLSVESFGNPRTFARTARRVGAVMPVLTVLTGRSAAAPPPARRTAGPAARRETLFEQAGIITTRGSGELVEAVALLATQPVPAGRSVAIVSNVGSAGRLAADACADLGLTVHHPHGLTRRRLHALVPATGAVAGPVDMTVTTSAECFRHSLELLAADEQVHAIIAVILPTGATGDLVQVVQQADLAVPLTVVVLDQPESVRLLPRRSGGRVPAYRAPEAAAAALARAVSYGAWRARACGRVPDFPDVETAQARARVREFLKHAPAGGWLPSGEAAELLRGHGIAVAADTDPPVPLGPAAGAVKVSVGVTADDIFGPLVALGSPGATAGEYAGQAARLTPLTDTEAVSLIRSARPAALACGQEATAAAVRDLVLRVSRLADDLPEVNELRLDPVIAGPDGARVAGARIKITPTVRPDLFLRRLR
jgi:acyl-CoA synthetase (NDP forming)